MEKTKKKAERQRKILKFKRSEDDLLNSADKRIADGEYLTALRLLNSCYDDFGPSYDLFEMMADVYELLEVNPQALRTCFYMLDICGEDDLPDAYEGIAVNYMNLGRDTQAAYYYNLLMQVDDEISEESKMELIESFSQPKKEKFRFVYPPEKADYGEQIEAGMRALKQGKCSLARESFAAVSPESEEQYNSARNLTAISYLLEDKYDKALSLCEQLLAENDEDVQAYITYAAVLGQLGRREEAVKVAKKLTKMQTDDTDSLYKIATVCCENELHKEALEKFTALEEMIPNEKNLLYFKAASAYKSGNTELCISTFERLLTVYPEASVARYYYDVVRYYVANKDKLSDPPDVSYFYTVPQPVRERYCELLSFLSKIRKDAAFTVGGEKQVETVLYWCFDEEDGRETELQEIAIDVAVHCNADRVLRKILLNPDVSDIIKLYAMETIAMENKENQYGVVICNIYRKVNFLHVNIGVKKHKKFLKAFAAVYAKFAIVSENYAKRICAATELLYHCLLAAGKLELAESTQDLAYAVYLLTGIKEAGIAQKVSSELFEADEQKSREMVKIVKAVTKKIHAKDEKDEKDEK
jgi:tetratricopeptide (TPR) repeat protein